MFHDTSYFIVPASSTTFARIEDFRFRRVLAINARKLLAQKYGAITCVGGDHAVQYVVFDSRVALPPGFVKKDAYPNGDTVAAPDDTHAGKMLARELSRSTVEIPGSVELHQLLLADPFGIRVSWVGHEWSKCGYSIKYAYLTEVNGETILCVPNAIDGMPGFLPPPDCRPLKLSEFFSMVEAESVACGVN